MSKNKYFLGTLVGVLSMALVGIFPTGAQAGYYYKAYNSNGGFESSNPGQGWGQYHNDLMNECANNCLLSASGTPHSGTWQAVLGGSDSVSDGIIYPVTAESHIGITLPQNASQITLTYYYKLITNDGTTSDAIRAVVADAASWASLTGQMYYSSTDNTSTWRMGSIDVTPFKANQIYFYFRLDNDDTPGTATSFYVDDVTLTAKISDTSKPGGAMNINKNKKWTKYAKVTLYLHGTDSGAGVKYMRFSNNKKKWTKWIKYSKTFKKWDMSKKKYGGNSRRGNKKVYVQFKDGAGNSSKVKADTIRWRW